MPLARDQHDILRPRLRNRRADRVAARSDFRGRSRALQHHRANSRRIFGPGIIVGHDHDIRHRRSNRTHLAPLAHVAVAACADHHDQPPTRMGLQRRDCRLQCIGRVRVIDIDGRAATGDDRAFEPAAHRLQPRQIGQCRRNITTARDHQRSGHQSIGRLIRADQREVHFMRLALGRDHQSLPQQGGFPRHQFQRLARRADRDHAEAAPARHLGHACRRRIVGPHYRDAVIGQDFAE